MNTKSIIEIFRGDGSDALGYQTIVGTIHTDLDLTGCKAVFRYLGFFQEFDPIPEDGKLTIVIPSASSMQFPPGFGYASLKVYDIDRKVRTFTNRIPVFVNTMTPCRGGGEFDVEFSPFPELAPLKIFKGPNADDFDLYTGFISKIIDRASAQKYGLSMLFDAMDAEKTAEGGCAASPAAVKAAYDAVIGVLTDNYYTKTQTDEAIDKLAAYYITSDTQGNPFATHAALVNATTYYSGGSIRTPTRNDYAIVVADETHNNEEWRYIYSENEQGVGQWEPQYAVEGVITFDDNVTRTSGNGVKSSGIWSALWGAALPTGFSSLYDWVVDQLSGYKQKQSPVSDPTVEGTAVEAYAITGITQDENGVIAPTKNYLPTAAPTEYMGGQNGLMSASDKSKLDAVTVLTSAQLAKIAAVSDALAFDATRSYAKGDPAVYNGTLYTFTEAHTGAWTGTDVSAVDIIARLADKMPSTATGADIPVDATQGAQKIDAALAGKANRASNPTEGHLATLDEYGNPADSGKTPYDFALVDIIAPEWDFNSTYEVGDLCTSFDNDFYHRGTWLYKCILAPDPQQMTPPEVDTTHWTLATVEDVLAALRSAIAGKQDALSEQQLANIAAVPNKANASDLRYALGTPTVISTASSETVEGETVYYGAATLADRTANIVGVAVALDELRVTIPPAISGKVRDFGLYVAVGLGEGTALAAPALVPVAPTGETITLTNAEGEMPTLADGTTTESGTTVLYFTEVVNGTFLVKGEEVKEIV